MLTGEKILVTGPAGRIAEPLCAQLAQHNDVWGIARFSEAGARERVERLGVTTRVCDIGDGEFAGLPDDFTIVLHIAASLGTDTNYDNGLRINAEGTGLLLQHCRRAKAALVMSTCSVYKPHSDPWHPYREDDPLGENALPTQPSYAITKIAQEAVARYAARAFNLPTVIARMNSAYGPAGGLPAMHLEQMLAGEAVVVRNDPCPYSPIEQNDINAQLESLLAAASVPATIVNWGGDEAVGPHDWCPFLAELAGVEANIVVREAPGAQRGIIVDTTRRQSLTGPCSVSWRDGMRAMLEARHPGLAGKATP
ncbi:MAG: NAD-dependent epimerase/dehydratase [Acidimicrobiia bacterium]|nr:NAD-dependent epimerase/dehydratase [Acidimicrobiia bacterium]